MTPSTYVIRVPTLRPRLAQDYDTLCMRLYLTASNPVRHASILAQIEAEAHRLNCGISAAFDDAWSHGRLMADYARVEDIDPLDFDPETGEQLKATGQ